MRLFNLLFLLVCMTSNAIAEPLSLSDKDDSRALIQKEVNWLANNMSIDNPVMPLSYRDNINYWKSVCEQNDFDCDSEGAIIERVLIHNGLDIYDGSVWEIALAIGQTLQPENENLYHQLERYELFLLNGRTIEGNSFKASMNEDTGKSFEYGYEPDDIQYFNQDKAFYFRFLTPTYKKKNIDPLTGKTDKMNDYKPVLGENAWATLIGPLQAEYLRTEGHFDGDYRTQWLASHALSLSLNILDATEAMQSPIGGVYYAVNPPGHTAEYAHNISLENNWSLYAGLQIFKRVLTNLIETTPEVDPDALTTTRLANAEKQVTNMIEKMDTFFENYAFDKEQGYFYQGGDYKDGQWHPDSTFATDVQTWGLSVLAQYWGIEKLDAMIKNQNAAVTNAYDVWQRTKEISGYYESDSDEILGVGYTEQLSHTEFSSEWSWGAVNMARVLAMHYKNSGEHEYATLLLTDAASIQNAIESQLANYEADTDEVAYYYANKRFYIPFGWYANRLPSTAGTAWAVMMQYHPEHNQDESFDPFWLGGFQSGGLNVA